MKKIISVFLIMAIISSSVCLAKAEYKDILPDAPYIEEIDTVVGLGLMKEESSETFNPQAYVTRGEFMEIVSPLMGIDSYGNTPARKSFSDVDVNASYAEAIANAYDLGIVSGNSSNFNPERYITYGEAVKIMIHILGYELHAAKKGGYPGGYMVWAANLDLTSGLSLGADDCISRGEIAMLLVNSFDAEIFSLVDERTLLEERLHLKSTEGRVTANSRTTLTGEGSVEDNELKIEFETYITDSKYDELLGFWVKCYYSEENGDRNIKYVYKTKKNETLFIDKSDIDVVSGGKVTYFADGKKKSVDIPKDSYVIYNHFSYVKYPSDVFDIENGALELLDSDNDGKIDVAFVYEYNNYLLKGVDAYNDRLYAVGNVVTVDDEKNEDMIIDGNTGMIIPIEEVTSGKLISVFENPENNGKTVYINHNTVEGVLESVSEDIIEIGGKEYKTTIADALTEKLGTAVRLYIDYSGIAVMLDDEYRSKPKYGYILNAGETGRLSPVVQLEIYTESAERKIYNAAEKMVVDGEKIEGKNLLTTLESRANAFGSTAGVSMLISYKINMSGEVSEIDTPCYVEKDEDEKSLMISVEYPNSTWVNVHYRESSNIFEGEFSVEPNVIIFIIPEDVESRKSDSEELANKFGVKTNSYLKTDTRYPAAGTSKMEVYNFNDTKTSNLIVFYSKIAAADGSGGANWDAMTGDDISGGWTGRIMVIDKISHALTSDGDYGVKISGRGSSGEMSYVMTETFAEIRSAALKNGNIIAFDQVDGQITGLKLLHTPESTEYKFERKYSFNNKDGISFGKVIKREGDFVLLRGLRTEVIDGTDTPVEREQVYTISDVVIYNREDKEARSGTADDILGEKEFYDNASDAFIYTSYGVSRLIVIYE